MTVALLLANTVAAALEAGVLGGRAWEALGDGRHDHRRLGGVERAAGTAGGGAGGCAPLRGPGLASVVVSDDYAAHAYERRLRRPAESVGCRFQGERLPADVEPGDALATIGKLNADPQVTGIRGPPTLG